MNEMNPIHWSIDYNTGSNKPDYANELIELLESDEITSSYVYNESEETNHTKHVYQILPNYWRGYAGRSNPDTKLGIGTVSIESKKEDHIWYYEVNYKNDTSGEDLLLQFSSDDSWSRNLLNEWYGKVRNSCQDTYSELNFIGRIISKDEVDLCINDVEISLAIPDKNIPITCNWTLFDVIPQLSDQLIDNRENVEIVLLEDLEQLRPINQIGFLNTLRSPFHLDGFYLYGIGLLPSYWWIDQKKTTVIVSNFFETYILKERIVEYK